MSVDRTDLSQAQPAPAPEVGQIWASADPRDVRRGTRQECLVVGFVTKRGEAAAVLRNLHTGRETAVRVGRMRPTQTGYRLVAVAR